MFDQCESLAAADLIARYINDWRNVFQHFDVDRSGTIEGHELAAALSQFGYRCVKSVSYCYDAEYSLQTHAIHPARVGG